MAFASALLFIAHAYAVLLLRPDRSFMATIFSRHSGGTMARRLLPLVIITPAVLGWLAILGEQAGWYGGAIGLALFATAHIVIFTFVVWLAARSLNRAESQRDTAEQRAVQLASALANFSDALIGLDPDARITSWSFAASRMLGYEQHEVIGRNAVELLVPESLPEERSHLLQRIRRDEAYVCETRWVTKGGGAIDVEVSVVPMHDADRKLIGQLTITRDIGARVRVAASLAAEHTLLRTLIDALPDVVFTKDLAGRFTMCNAAALAAVGATREEDLLGKTVFDFYPPELADLYHADDMNAIAGQTVFNRDEPSLERDGRARWFLTIKTPLRGASGAVVGLIGISRNITDRKATEESLRESEQRFRLLAESLPQLIWTCDAQGQCDFFSRQWVEYTGIAADRQLGTAWLAQVHPDDRDALMQTWQAAVADRSDFSAEFRVRSRQGSYRWFDTRAVPVRDKDGGVLMWVGSNTDIHDAREMREALRGQARLFDLAPVVVLDMAGHVVFWSQGAEALFGFAKTGAVDRLAHELLQSEFPEPLERIREALDRTGIWEGEVVHRAQDGSRLFVHSHRALQTDPHGGSQRVLEVSADITPRKRIEEELRNSERRFRALIEHSTDSIAVIDQNNTITYLSPAVAAVEGYAPEELIGRNGAENTHLDDLPVVQKIVEELVANPGKPVPVLWRRRHKKGHWLWLEGVATNLLHDPAVAGIVTNYRDVTDRRRATEVQLRSQKMEALGTLAGGIAHDFNNILLAILGNTKLAMEDLPVDHPVQKGLSEIAKGSTRAADLVRRILTFTRQQEPERDVIELQPVIEEVNHLLRSSLPAMIELRTKFEAPLPPIAADPTQIHQLVLNLATNSAYAIGERPGVIEIVVKTMVPDAHMIATTPDLHEGRYVHLCISDDGSGMDPATRERIFDPFFTTKPVGSGTGLGLSIVHGILKSHGGAISVYSAVGKGTTFHLYFPALAPTGDAVQPPAKTLLRGADQRILYVDDEEPLNFLAERILPRLGYRVSTYTEPELALQAFRAHPNDFDAVVTDLSMPGMSGFEFARGVLAIRPDIPILMMSGYLRPTDQTAAAELNIRDLILKPNAFEDLGHALGRLFGKDGDA